MGKMKRILLVLLVLCALGPFGLSGCGEASSPLSNSVTSVTGGSTFNPPATVLMAPFSSTDLRGTPQAGIDVSSVNQGYVGAIAESQSRLKLQVTKDGTSFNYDLPNDGTPIIAPLNMGNGIYTFAIMQNTSENRYVELFSTTADAQMPTQFEPFIRPNVFCDYTADGPVVQKAHELTAGATNEGDALASIYEWIRDNIVYDRDKAAELAGKSGYVPNPAETLATKKGICFDYASLAAAMMRSLGIPCKIITGYVSPDGIYHAWNMIWIDGSWKTVAITVDPQTWTRIDLTFAAGGDESTVGDGERYEDRYVY